MPELYYYMHIAVILMSNLDHSFKSTVQFNLVNSVYVPCDSLLSICCSVLRTHLTMQPVVMFVYVEYVGGEK